MLHYKSVIVERADVMINPLLMVKLKTDRVKDTVVILTWKTLSELPDLLSLLLPNPISCQPCEFLRHFLNWWTYTSCLRRASVCCRQWPRRAILQHLHTQTVTLIKIKQLNKTLPTKTGLPQWYGQQTTTVLHSSISYESAIRSSSHSLYTSWILWWMDVKTIENNYVWFTPVSSSEITIQNGGFFLGFFWHYRVDLWPLLWNRKR